MAIPIHQNPFRPGAGQTPVWLAGRDDEHTKNAARGIDPEDAGQRHAQHRGIEQEQDGGRRRGNLERYRPDGPCHRQ